MLALIFDRKDCSSSEFFERDISEMESVFSSKTFEMIKLRHGGQRKKVLVPWFSNIM